MVPVLPAETPEVPRNRERIHVDSASLMQMRGAPWRCRSTRRPGSLGVSAALAVWWASASGGWSRPIGLSAAAPVSARARARSGSVAPGGRGPLGWSRGKACLRPRQPEWSARRRSHRRIRRTPAMCCRELRCSESGNAATSRMSRSTAGSVQRERQLSVTARVASTRVLARRLQALGARIGDERVLADRRRRPAPRRSQGSPRTAD